MTRPGGKVNGGEAISRRNGKKDVTLTEAGRMWMVGQSDLTILGRFGKLKLVVGKGSSDSLNYLPVETWDKSRPNQCAVLIPQKEQLSWSS